MKRTENLFETFDEAYEFLDNLVRARDDIVDSVWFVISPNGTASIDPDEMGFIYISVVAVDDSENEIVKEVAGVHVDGITEDNLEFMNTNFELAVPSHGDFQ